MKLEKGDVVYIEDYNCLGIILRDFQYINDKINVVSKLVQIDDEDKRGYGECIFMKNPNKIILISKGDFK